MKILKNLSIFVVAIIIFNQTANAQIIITKLGDHPFYAPSLTSKSDLYSMIGYNVDDIEKGFKLAGIPSVFDDFMDQVFDAEVTKVNLGDGTKFDWMFHRKNGTGPVLLAKNLTWVNNVAIEAYKFHIDSGDKRYTFAIPLVCSNLSLRGITNIPIGFVPSVKEEKEVQLGESSLPLLVVPPVKVESSIEPEPEIVAAPVIINKPTKETAKPETKIQKTRAVPATAAAPAAGLGLKLLGDLGYLHQFDPGDYLLARLGLERMLGDNFSILGLVGVAPHISGSDGVTAYVADLLAEFKFGRAFMDLGLGGWITGGDDNIESENTQLDIIMALGTMIYGEKDDFNISLFLEARHGTDELVDKHTITSFGRYGGGLRFRF